MNTGPSAQIVAWIVAASFVALGIWGAFEVGNPAPVVIALVPAFFFIRWFG